MKNIFTGKKGFMAMKLVISKAYDRVKWVFLEKILLKMGFLVCMGSFDYGVYYHCLIFYPCE